MKTLKSSLYLLLGTLLLACNAEQPVEHQAPTRPDDGNLRIAPNEIYQQAKSISAATGSLERYTIISVKDVSTNTTVGPLMDSEWHQWSPFNKKVPVDCPAGCAAIATGQIMKFHRHPATYNWSRMEDGIFGQYDDGPNLIADIGRAVKMSYTSTGSGANVDEVAKGIRQFGYGVTKKDNLIWDVQEEVLTHQRPVYMRGQLELGRGTLGFVTALCKSSKRESMESMAPSTFELGTRRKIS